MGFYAGYFTAVDSALAGYVTSKAAAVIAAISGVTTSMFILYVAFYVLAITRGLVKEPVWDFALRIAKIALILGIALNFGLYMKYIGNFLNDSPDQLASVLSGGGGTVGSTLDSVADSCAERAKAAWDKAGLLKGDFGMYLIAAAFAVVMVAGTVYAAFLITLAKGMLAILLALGPLAIILLVFNTTQRYFEAWFSTAINYGLVIVISSAVLGLFVSILGFGISSSATGDAVGFWDAVRLIALAIITALIFAQVPSVAANLGSGVAISTLSFAERASSGAFRRTLGKQPYTNDKGQTIYRRPLSYRTGQAAAGVGRAAKYLYRKGTRQDINRVDRG